jgi:hypothetical protein
MKEKSLRFKIRINLREEISHFGLSEINLYQRLIRFLNLQF